MSLLEEAFSSKTKVQLLRVFSWRAQSFSLRQLAELAEAPLFSVQKAIEQLFAEKLILKSHSSNKTLYSLNPAHPLADLMIKIYTFEATDKLKKRSFQYTKAAKRTLQFMQEAQSLYTVIKRSSVKA